MSHLNTANHKCVYVNCFNSKRVEKDLAFFKFPVKNTNRLEQWKRNCGNVKIAAMNVDVLKSKLICEKHFLPGDFLINNKRKLLTKTALPVNIIKEEPSDETTQPQPKHVVLRTYERKRQFSSIASDDVFTPSSSLAASCSIKDEQEWLDTPTDQVADLQLPSNSPQTEHPELWTAASDDDSKISIEHNDILQMVSPTEATLLRQCQTYELPQLQSAASDNDSKISIVNNGILQMASPTEATLLRQCRTYSSKLKVAKKKLNALQSQTYRLKKKVAGFSTATVLDNLMKNKSPALKTFVNMQLCHERRTYWSKAEKDLALSLYHKSSRTYTFMVQNLQFVLPSIRTVQLWLKVGNLRSKSPKPHIEMSILSKVD